MMTHTRPLIGPVLESYGAVLRDRYGWQPIRCPFHDDRTASASVSLEDGAFACHACDVRGDVYACIMAYNNCDFKEALEIGDNFTPDNTVPAQTKRTYKPMGRRGRLS